MPVVCRLTAPLPAAIATLQVTGDQAYETLLASGLINKPELEIGRLNYCRWPLSNGQETVYEQLVICRTDVQRIEICCHGGSAVCQAIIDSLVNKGFSEAEFETLPSQYHCPIQQAAETDLIQAKTDRAAAILLDQVNGSLSQELAELRSLVVEAEKGDQVAKRTAIQRVGKLLDYSDLGLHLITPWQVVLAGPPNVGKSSLLNEICGQQKAIVHEEAGTTRDWIDGQIVLEGWPIALTDTAGIRTTLDSIEAEGVRRAQERVAQADLLILVVDAVQGWTDTHERLSEFSGQKLVALNKSDLARHSNVEGISNGASTDIVRCSALGAPGIQELLESITSSLVPNLPQAGAPIPFRKEQVEQLISLRTALQDGKFQFAAEQLTRPAEA